MRRAMIGRMLTVLQGLTLAGCGDEASVGSDGCYQGITCQELIGQGDFLANRTSSEIYERLPATWTRATLGTTPVTQDSEALQGLGSLADLASAGALSGAGLGGLSSALPPLPLAIGPQKTPWVFVTTGASLTALFVDGSGELLAEHSFSPPTGFAPVENTTSSISLSAQSHSLGPVLTAWWYAGASQCDMHGCGATEVMLFGIDPTQPPQRILLQGEQRSVRTAFRNSQGDRIIMPVSSPTQQVLAIDTSGKLAWERSMPDLSSDYSFFRFAFSDSDELLITLAPRLDDPLGYTLPILYPSPFTVLSVTESATQLTELLPPAGVALMASTPAPFIPPAGPPRLVSTSQLGDLSVFGMANGSQYGPTTLIREDYTTLSASAGAMDERGTLYLSTVVGGRQLEDRVPLLCRVPPSLSGFTCFEVDALPYAIVTGEPDIVYTMSLTSGLSRYDF